MICKNRLLTKHTRSNKIKLVLHNKAQDVLKPIKIALIKVSHYLYDIVQV